jgi:hypothetical protein
VPGFHAFNGMPILVHVVDAQAHQPYPHRRDTDVGLAVKGLAVALRPHRPEALSSAEIMNAVHD